MQITRPPPKKITTLYAIIFPHLQHSSYDTSNMEKKIKELKNKKNNPKPGFYFM